MYPPNSYLAQKYHIFSAAQFLETFPLEFLSGSGKHVHFCSDPGHLSPAANVTKPIRNASFMIDCRFDLSKLSSTNTIDLLQQDTWHWRRRSNGFNGFIRQIIEFKLFITAGRIARYVSTFSEKHEDVRTTIFHQTN